MSNCSKHKKEVEKYNGSMKDLVNDIGNLHYNSLKEFLLMLSLKIKEDSKNDKKGGRCKLSDVLLKSSEHLYKSYEFINDAWLISEPFMKKENLNN